MVQRSSLCILEGEYFAHLHGNRLWLISETDSLQRKHLLAAFPSTADSVDKLAEAGASY